MRMWRCPTCGKWSHAKRKPSRHKMWLSATDYSEPPLGMEVVREVPPEYDHLNGFTSDGGWYVRCAPWEEWWAEKVQKS